MELRIEKIVYPGRSLGLQQGQVVFTDEGLPGELVSVKILAERKNFLEGKIVEILEPVPDRIKPHCSHYRACSPYQIMTYELETKIKSGQLAEILSRFKIPYHQGAGKSPDLVPSPQIYGYRNKIKLTVVWNSPQPFLAYHEPGSPTDLLPVENCALVSGEVNSLLSAFQELIKTSPLPAISQIEIRQSFSAGALLAILYSENKQGLTEAAGRWLPHLSNQPGLTGIAGLLLTTQRPDRFLSTASSILKKNSKKSGCAMARNAFFRSICRSYCKWSMNLKPGLKQINRLAFSIYMPESAPSAFSFPLWLQRSWRWNQSQPISFILRKILD